MGYAPHSVFLHFGFLATLRRTRFCVQLPRTHEPMMLSERRLQLIDLVGERVDQLLQLGGRLEVVVVHRGLHLVFRLLLPCEQLRQTRGARVVPARRRSLG